MTSPDQHQRVVTPGMTLPRFLLLVGAVLFVIAAFAAGGHPLADIDAWSWGFGAFAAWTLSGAV